MAEYIEREALMKYPIRIDHYDKENGNEHFVLGIESVLEYAEALPAADVVEVVRCKNCIRCEEERGFMGPVLYCLHWVRNTVEDGYCHEGIKRMDGE